MEWQKKTIWLINHYATITMFDHGGRHYAFAKYLLRAGYDVKVFCASTVHASDKQLIEDGRLYYETECDGIPFVIVRTARFQGNGMSRVRNMLDFFFRMLRTARHFARPDVIVGSSVHPLACVDAILLARRLHCPAIAEIRDLWPESIIAYTGRSRNNPAIRLLYRLEKWIYTKADALIFTMEGGRDYIVEQGWDTAHGGRVDMDKVFYINNGVDMEAFCYNRAQYPVDDPELDDPDTFKAVYTGTIGTVNDLDALVAVAENLQSRGENRIKLIVYGGGTELERLLETVRAKGLTNIVFKGRVDKTRIPYILSKCDLNLMHGSVHPNICRYGTSPNKCFDYLASGKPALSSMTFNYNFVAENGCGVCETFAAPEQYADAILRFANMPQPEYAQYCENALRTAKEFSYETLTDRLIGVAESVMRGPDGGSYHTGGDRT